MELIKVEQKEIGIESLQTVNARELHAFLESKQRFADWIKARIEQYGFAQGVDYIDHKIMTQLNQIDRIDYHISIDMAKELAMVERNDKGKQARQYFIECEKRLKATVPAPAFQIPQTYAEALQLAADQAKQLEAAKPAVEFVERYVETKQSQCLSDVAKIIGWRPRGFISQLEKDGILFHRGTWLPRQEQIDAGRFEVKTGEEKGFAFRQTRVTPKGITWLAQKYGVGTELTH